MYQRLGHIYKLAGSLLLPPFAAGGVARLLGVKMVLVRRAFQNLPA